MDFWSLNRYDTTKIYKLYYNKGKTTLTNGQRKDNPMPSQEQGDSSIVSLRLADTLLDRLDRYLDWMETRRGEKSSRNRVMRQALTQWLPSQ